MGEILQDITEGKGTNEHLELLEELGGVIKDTALCALGGTAANPVLSTIKYFRNEYKDHIEHKKCPAGVCKALITYTINEDKCIGCGACLKQCPQDAITGEKKQSHIIDQEKCIKCDACFDACKVKAINRK
jgi:Na+-translocating ferredoxin:NAD+ oxidoreductase RNF subunit RnfB